MYKQCRTEQSAARQHQFEAGLLRAMQAKHYEQISVSDLCNEMQIPRKSFYRYFSGKDGALHALIDHTLISYEGFKHPYRQGEKRTLARDLEGFFQFWIENKPLLDALQRSSMSGLLIERSVAHAVSETVIPARFLPGDSKQMRQQITMFGVCGLMAMVLDWHHTGYPKTAMEMAQIAVRLLSMPLFPDAGACF